MSANAKTVAVVAMGEMGSAIAARLVQNGVRVITTLEGRSETSIARARRGGIEAVTTDTLTEQAHIFLSIVPPHAAVETAEHYLPLLQVAGRNPLYVDCNAVAPETLGAIAASAGKAGIRFADASIIGAAPKPEAGKGPRFYVSGNAETESRWLSEYGLDTRYLSANAGDASALKMAYAGITKGFQALGTAMILGAARNDASEALVQEICHSVPELADWLRQLLHRMPPKAYRWDGEMREIAKFLQPETGAEKMLSGAADLYQHVASDFAEGDQSEIMLELAKFFELYDHTIQK